MGGVRHRNPVVAYTGAYEMSRIVLAHGILGFGSVLPEQPRDYFNGIRSSYESQGHEVFCPSVPPLGSLDARAHKLESQLLARWPDDGSPIFLLAHSMGGLDCRRVLARNQSIARRVRRLITIATPHFGSPVANAVLHRAPSGLPSPLQLAAQLFARDAGALNDLQIRSDLQDPSVATVDYLCIGCDATGTTFGSPVFAVTAAVGDFGKIENDGVVSLASSSNSNSKTTLLEIWSVDHGGAVGWPSDGLGSETAEAAKRPPAEHLARYQRLLARLLA